MAPDQKGIYIVTHDCYSFGAGVHLDREGQSLEYGRDGAMIVSGFNLMDRLSYIVGTVSSP